MLKLLAQIIVVLILTSVAALAAQVGVPAPAFHLADLQGNPVSLERLRGKVVFLDFWAPWCAPCREELPVLDELYKKYKNDGFQVLGISLDASERSIGKYLLTTPVAFPVMIDRKSDVADAYGFSGLPAGFLIDKNGIIRYRHAGFDKSFVAIYEKEIVELLHAP